MLAGDSEVGVEAEAGADGGAEQQENIFSEAAVFKTDKPEFAYTESEAY